MAQRDLNNLGCDKTKNDDVTEVARQVDENIEFLVPRHLFRSEIASANAVPGAFGRPYAQRIEHGVEGAEGEALLATGFMGIGGGYDLAKIEAWIRQVSAVISRRRHAHHEGKILCGLILLVPKHWCAVGS